MKVIDLRSTVNTNPNVTAPNEKYVHQHVYDYVRDLEHSEETNVISSKNIIKYNTKELRAMENNISFGYK